MRPRAGDAGQARKPAGNPRVRAWLQARSANELYLSVLIVRDIRAGVERLRRRDPAQAEAFDRWLAGLCAGYGDRILPVTSGVADEWGRLNDPDPLPVVDGLMAATARVHGLTLVTPNRRRRSHRGCASSTPSSPG